MFKLYLEKTDGRSELSGRSPQTPRDSYSQKMLIPMRGLVTSSFKNGHREELVFLPYSFHEHEDRRLEKKKRKKKETDFAFAS